MKCENMFVALVVVTLLGSAIGKHNNFCRPLEDYGPREDNMEERQVCQTNMVKDCKPVTESDCMDITELRCELNLVTNCTMDWTMKDSVESLMSVKSKDLKNCTKEMVVEYHDKTIYDCKNVTKRHCTTLWTVNDVGEKVWAGNEDDCKDVTWEECNPLQKKVPMSVAQMVCVDSPVTYFDYENTTTPQMADTMDCSVEKKAVCEPVTSKKCAEVTYTRCEELPVTDCSTVEIPVPSQQKLHKQWCLFDQAENIDFDTEVKKIKKKQKSLELQEGTSVTEEDNEDILDLRTPEKREIQPIVENLRDFALIGDKELKPRYKKKRHTERANKARHANAKHVTANKKIVRMTQNVSHQ